MKALVVYESMFGNTAAIAEVIADSLRESFEVTVAEAGAMPSTNGTDLLVVGAPTHAFGLSRPASRQEAADRGQVRPGAVGVGLREYLDVSPTLTGMSAAAFDTRVDKPRLPGSAAHKANRRLHRLGCAMLCPPESFRVVGTVGPLVDGELERARAWARQLATKMMTERHHV